MSPGQVEGSDGEVPERGHGAGPAWRTRAEVAASPNQASMGFPGREAADNPPVILPRAALLMDGARQAEDITVRLRHQATG